MSSCADLLVAGVDIGGTHVTCVLMDNAGTVLKKEVTPVTDRSVDAVVDVIARGLNVILSELDSIHCIGVGVPGNVDPVERTARYLPNFGWPLNVPLGQLISTKLIRHSSTQILMRNDGRCAALAESRYGAGKEAKVFSMLTIGTGIGGALVINNTLFDGSTFDAGDFGHAVIRSDIDAFECNCGKRGCFETQASAYGLVKQYQKQHQMTNHVDNPSVTNAQEVLHLVRIGDSIACRAFNIFMDDLSTGLANLVTFYNPDVIALGGGLAQATEIFQQIQSLIDNKTLPATRGKCKVIPAALGPDAGAIGAGVLASMYGHSLNS